MSATIYWLHNSDMYWSHLVYARPFGRASDQMTRSAPRIKHIHRRGRRSGSLAVELRWFRGLQPPTRSGLIALPQRGLSSVLPAHCSLPCYVVGVLILRPSLGCIIGNIFLLPSYGFPFPFWLSICFSGALFLPIPSSTLIGLN